MFGKKGNTGVIWGVIGIVAALAIAGIFSAYTLDITGDVKADFTTDSYAYNATTNAEAAQDVVTGKFDTLGTIGVITLVLAMLMGVAGLVGYRMAN